MLLPFPLQLIFWFVSLIIEFYFIDCQLRYLIPKL